MDFQLLALSLWRDITLIRKFMEEFRTDSTLLHFPKQVDNTACGVSWIFSLTSRIWSLLFSSCDGPWRAMPCTVLTSNQMWGHIKSEDAGLCQIPGFANNFPIITQVFFRWERQPYFSFKGRGGSALAEGSSKALSYMFSSASRTRECALPRADHPRASPCILGYTEPPPPKCLRSRISSRYCPEINYLWWLFCLLTG